MLLLAAMPLGAQELGLYKWRISDIPLQRAYFQILQFKHYLTSHKMRHYSLESLDVHNWERYVQSHAGCYRREIQVVA